MKLEFPLVLDGAMGTQLYKKGYTPGICPEQWSLENKDKVVSIQKAYVDAGSQVIYTPTFGANRIVLERNKIIGKVREYNLALVDISKEASGGRALIAGDMSPTGAMLKPLGQLTFEEMFEIYREQAAALEEAGVDLFVIETMMTVAEARAAVLAVKSVSDKPVFVTFTCSENGRTMTGTDIRAALVIMQSMGVSAFGMNCSVGPGEMAEQIRKLKEITRIPLIAKPNAGLPKNEDGINTYDVTADEFASFVPVLADAGASIFGGCCGTDESFIAAVKTALETVSYNQNNIISETQLCATERNIFSLEEMPEFSEIFDCDEDLEDNLMDSNPGDPVAVRFSSEEDLEIFAECQFSVSGPLCMICEDAEILEKALRLYQGRAIYFGELSALTLAPLVRKYGLIIKN